MLFYHFTDCTIFSVYKNCKPFYRIKHCAQLQTGAKSGLLCHPTFCKFSLNFTSDSQASSSFRPAKIKAV